MEKNDIVAYGSSLYRVLNVADDTMFVMDCLNPKMPFWISGAEADCKYVTEQELYERTGKTNVSLDDLDPVRRRVALNRYTIIAGILLELENKYTNMQYFVKAIDQEKRFFFPFLMIFRFVIYYEIKFQIDFWYRHKYG